MLYSILYDMLHKKKLKLLETILNKYTFVISLLIEFQLIKEKKENYVAQVCENISKYLKNPTLRGKK